MAQPYLSIIIPAYNEAERIPQTLVDMDRRLEGAPYSYEIVVVNDGSKDATADVVRNMTKIVRNLKLIDLKDNQGKGGAVRQGMLLSSGKVRLFADADNSTTIDQFDAMMPLFKQGYGVVIGSRAVKGARLDPPESFGRQLAGKGLNLIVQALLVPGIWDTQCGFKAFTDEAAERVFNQSKIVGWGFDVEALALARAMGFAVKEVPVRWANDARSHVRFSSGLQFLRDLIKIRLWLWRGGYPLAAATPSQPPA
ncbi:MAG TPA: dolichyl-phosphate beta-glucosyltransferase [Candidatus Paceibacterota bacterium]|nr:dolichyl-phosphate beta-glucosyltransferase [Candidatus Paceibacterota bacterium]